MLIVATLLLCASCSQRASYPAAPVRGTDIVIDTANLEHNVPQFFTYHSGGKDIRFFVLSMNDRTLSFLDACESCYQKKQGYRHEDGRVVCRACNMEFSIYKLEKGIGGCFPIKIEGTMRKDGYVIPAASLDRMADKF